MKLHGIALSPWVRRLMVFLAEKNVEYELVHCVPAGKPSADLLRMNPLGRIPVLELDDGRVLPDSLAACIYLDGAYSGVQLIPSDDFQRAWTFWLCEFIASAVFAKFEGTIFVQRVVKPGFEKVDPDEKLIADAKQHIPPAYDYLEKQLLDTPYLGSEVISLADVTAASILLNMRHAGEEIDAMSWPNLADYIERMHKRASFVAQIKTDLEMIGHVSALGQK